MRNGNEACLTTTSMKSGHRSKVKVVLALEYHLFWSVKQQLLEKKSTQRQQSTEITKSKPKIILGKSKHKKTGGLC